MSLKLSLKPHEKLILGGAVVTNGNTAADLIIESSIPVLREKDIMREQDADSPCKRIYFIIQLMYIDEKNLAAHHNTYWTLVRDVLDAAPSTFGMIDQISWLILNGKYYQAMKTTKKLIHYEQEAIDHARNSGQCVSPNK